MTDNTWYHEARGFVMDHAKGRRVFSGNELWAAGLRNPGNRRLLAGVLLGLEKDGHLIRVGRTESVGGHGQPILMWKKA